MELTCVLAFQNKNEDQHRWEKGKKNTW